MNERSRFWICGGLAVFAGVRREEDAQALRRAASARLTPLRLEITDPEQIAAAAGEQIADAPAADGPPAHARYYADTVARMLAFGKKMQARAGPPRAAADAIAHALSARRPRRIYLVGLDARFQLRAHQLVPARAFDWLVAKALRT